MATETTGYSQKLNQSCSGLGADTAISSWDPSSVVGTSGTITFGNPQIPVCPAGHIASHNYAEYLDGEIATSCESCGQRITFKALPGGVPLLRLKWLIEQVMGGGEVTSRTLEDFAAIKDALQTERQVLDAADALLAVAQALLEK